MIRSKTKELNTKKIVDLFGGKHKIVADYEAILRTVITVKAIEKWIERRAISMKQILNLKVIAKERNIEFNLEDFVN